MTVTMKLDIYLVMRSHQFLARTSGVGLAESGSKGMQWSVWCAVEIRYVALHSLFMSRLNIIFTVAYQQVSLTCKYRNTCTCFIYYL
jgi:hypothetical protein